MGDVIHTLPAAQALRDAFPEAMIGWLIEERWAELLCAPGTPRRGPRSAQRPLVDWVHTVNLTGWRKSLFIIATLQQIATVWNDVRAVHYDIAVDLQGAIRSAVLARWSGAPVVYGAAEPRESPASLWYTRPVIARGAHVIEQNLSLAEAVTAEEIDMRRQCSFPHDAEPSSELRPSARATCGLREFRHPESWRRMGSEALARATIWPSCERSGAGWSAFDPELWSGRRGSGARGRGCERGAAMAMQCSITELIALTRRAKSVYRRRHRSAASGGGVASSGGGDFRTHRSRAQRALWTRSIVLRNPASSTSHARRPRPTKECWRSGVEPSWTRLAAAGIGGTARWKDAHG